jgi:phosphoribosylamine--glycine ligase
MAAEGNPYRGILYVGLMIEDGEPRVVEYNCRFGDPETQVILPMLKSDPVELFRRMATKQMANYEIELYDGAAACVVMASAGYPEAYSKGCVISGLSDTSPQAPDALIFHAGTERTTTGEVVTSGGRVLAICGRGNDLQQALDQAYYAVSTIHFEGAYFRRDIGQKGLV